MNIIESLAFFAIMLALAALPSTSVALVVTRSATLGVRNGVAVAAGIVLGDIVFVVLTLVGLSIVAEATGSLFVLLKYLGAMYLIWLGFSLLNTGNETGRFDRTANKSGSLFVSFLAGFALTLGDLKAVAFYASLFPLFVDLSELRMSDALVIVMITIASVGGVKFAYALSARKLATWLTALELENFARKAAGGIMLGAGAYIIAKA